MWELRNENLKELFNELSEESNSGAGGLITILNLFQKCDKAIEEEIEALKTKIELLQGEIKCHEVGIQSRMAVIKEQEEEIEALKSECDNKSTELREAIQRLNNERKHGEDLADIHGTTYESLVKAIEFKNKKIEELEAEKARLKEAYDIQETTINRLKVLLGKEHKENVDLSYGHEFEFGDEVFVPWSDAPYMYIKSGMMYNPRTESLVYVGKTQHLKWFGEKFAIV